MPATNTLSPVLSARGAMAIAGEHVFDLGSVPWSRHGAYMAITTNVATIDHPGRNHEIDPGIYLTDVSGSRLWRWNGVFRIELTKNGSVVEPTVIEGRPGHLRIVSEHGEIEATWDGTSTIRFSGRGIGIRFVQSVIDPMDAALAFPIGESEYRLQMGEDAHYSISSIAGNLTVDAPRVRTGASDTADRKVVDANAAGEDRFEIALTQYESGYKAPKQFRPFAEALQDTRDDFSTWWSAFRPRETGITEAAAYLTWSTIVAARGISARPAMLMSKNWMNAVWSWDHCFNALGLARSHPDLAWDQFMLPFDQQHPQGALPDLMHDNGLMWGFVKPPVHGWTLNHLIDLGVATPERIADVYPKLVAWTNWWLAYRDLNDDGLPVYFHGCDSGQDNSTAFDAEGFPSTSPDLATFFALQLRCLSRVATMLGLHDEARRWTALEEQTIRLMISKLWGAAGFSPRGSLDNEHLRGLSTSQVVFLPLLLGDALPVDVRDLLLEQFLSSGLLTAHGVASESPASASYEPDGYWRGPIWSPTTLLIADGLHRCKRSDLTQVIAQRFLANCDINGFAENYDAVTGRGLRDRAYSWSASVYNVFSEQSQIFREPEGSRI